MQEVFCIPRTSEGPILFLTPLVSAQHEEFHRVGMREIVGNVLEKIVVPAQSSFVLVKWSGRAEIYIANFAARTGVAADRDQEMLSAARGFVFAMQFHSDVVAYRSSQKNVI